MTPIDFVITFLILALTLSISGWWTARKRRIKLKKALDSLIHIQDLTTEIIHERDREKCTSLNQVINGWNINNSSLVGYTIPNIDCSSLPTIP